MILVGIPKSSNGFVTNQFVHSWCTSFVCDVRNLIIKMVKDIVDRFQVSLLFSLYVILWMIQTRDVDVDNVWVFQLFSGYGRQEMPYKLAFSDLRYQHDQEDHCFVLLDLTLAPTVREPFSTINVRLRISKEYAHLVTILHP